MIYLWIYLAGVVVAMPFVWQLTLKEQSYLTLGEILEVMALSLLSWMIYLFCLFMWIDHSKILDKVVWRKKEK